MVDEMPVWIIQEGSHTGRIGIGLGPNYLKILKALPGTHYSKKDEIWTLPKTWSSALMIGSLARENHYKVKPSPELAAWIMQEKKDWSVLAGLAAEPTRKVEPGGLFGHQVVDIEWLTFPGGPNGRLLLSEMGVGKTRSVVEGIKAIDGLPALIVCPKSVAIDGWLGEFETTAPKLRVGLALGTVTKRRKIFDAVKAGELDVAITGYEIMRAHTRYGQFGSIALKRCVKCGGPPQSDEAEVTESKCQAHAKELNEIDWRVIVADEAHRILNASSQNRLAMYGLMQSAPQSKRWALTGTPVSKKPDGVWSLLNFVDYEGWPVKSDWVNRYCEQGIGNSGYWEVSGFKDSTSKEFHASFGAISRRVLKAQVLDLPPMLRGKSLIRQVTMGTVQRQAYVQMRDEMILQIDGGLIVAANAAVKMGRLTLLASATGTPNPADGSVMDLRMPSAKIEELAEMLAENEITGQFAVAASSRKFLVMIMQELIKRKLLREDQVGIIAGGVSDEARALAIKRFQTGDIPAIFYTHAAGGVGVTLHAASTLVLMERHWANNIMTQSLARVHRAGMPNRAVNVVDIIAESTVETHQMKRLEEDADLLEEVVHDSERLKEFLLT